MNSLSTIYLITAFSFFYIAYFSLANNGRSHTYRTYALLNIIMGIWSIVDMHKAMALSAQAFLFAKQFDFWYFPAIFVFFHFSLIIAKKEFISKQSFLIPYYALSVIFILVYIFFLQPIDVTINNSWYTSSWSSSQLTFYRIIIAIPTFMGVTGAVLLYINLYRGISGKNAYKKILILIVFIIPIFAATITHYILDILWDLDFFISLTVYFVIPNLLFSFFLNQNSNPDFTFEGMLHDILHNNQDILIVTDENNDILFVNSTFKRKTNLSENEVQKMNIDTFFKRFFVDYKKDQPSFSETDERECRFQSKDNEISYVNINVSSAYNREKKSKGYLYIIKDINEKRNLERHLKQLSVAVEQSQNTVVITDKDGNIEYANPVFEKITGYKRNSVLGKNPRFLKSGKHDNDHYKEFWETISNGNTWNGDFLNRKKDGSLYWERCTVTPVLDHNKNIINYIAVKDDITKEKQLQEFQRDIDRMMRHDIKTPLNGIINFPDLIMQNQNLSEEDKELLQLTKDAGKQILNQIDLFMNISKLEEGRFIYDPASHNIAFILHSIIKELSAISAERKVKISLLVYGSEYKKSDEIILNTDKTLFYTMASNIIKNAIEASNPGQQVTISIEKSEKNSHRLRVHNETPIPAEIRRTFFDKYTTMGKKTGTGLGTYSAKLMAEAMNARIYFTTRDGDGTNPEDGTSIFIEFPN